MDKNKIGMLVAALLLITFTVAVTVINHSTEGAAEAWNQTGGAGNAGTPVQAVTPVQQITRTTITGNNTTVASASISKLIPN